MFICKEKRAFWLFLLWVLILPVLHQPGLSAQDDDMFIVDDSQAEPLPDEAATDSVAAGETGLAAEPDNAGPEGEEPEDLHPELPALSADPNELLAKVNGLAKAGKHKEVINALQDHEDAVSELKELLAIYVEALISSDKVDWTLVNRMARDLSRKDSDNSLANYAQGMYHQNAKKPDLGKSLVFLGKAKASKNPYPAVAAAYYMALAKKYGVIALALVLLPIVVVIKKRKARKAAVVDLDGLPDQTAGKEGESSAEKTGASAEASPDKGIAADKKAEPKKKVKTAVKGKTAKEKTAVEAKEETAPAESEASEPGDEESGAEESGAEEEVTKQPASAPVAPTAPAAPPVAPAPQPVVAQPVSTPSPAVYQTITAKHQAEIEQVRDLIRPGRRPPVQADPELDSLWGDLSRKALQGRIAPQFRREETSGGYRPGSARSTGSGASAGGYPEPMTPEIDFNVSMDLSEESLKDDLTVKLRMMAISDSELRDLFAQKNPRHIPHLIEYVLTKPEPVRLAFVARELGSYDDPGVIDVLAGLLYNEDHRVALAAIQGLEISKKVPAILHLCPFLKSEVPLLAQAARTALSNFGAVKIMQAFHNLPQNSDERIRSAGVFVMSRMKGAQVEETLKQMLNDDSLDVRCDVILAMSYQKNPVYLDSLREFFRIASDRDKTLARKAIVYLQGFVTRKK